ncbi:hypothetical protein QN277_017677 [Acacia crassicarpa]|uniref:Uncharacterized protein n=1 Tax=Acacia crassicarpa TaxID=499986 RepID=A0AAE1MS23_9FABA|nr:hypothetical protein QN277_017677 [Acacia crassicarpa]
MAPAIAGDALVKAATEGTGMVGRRAHTGSFRGRDGVILLRDDMTGDRSVGRDGTVVNRKSDGGGRRVRGIKIDTSGRSRTMLNVMLMTMGFIEKGGGRG